MSRPYQPSNGTEGEYFLESFCANCIHDKYQSTGNPNDKMCDIIASTMAFSKGDPEYPTEWIQDDNGNNPRCTKWTKWDWGNDGDPDDEDNPKAPEPIITNQLDLFPFYPVDLIEVAKQEQKTA